MIVFRFSLSFGYAMNVQVEYPGFDDKIFQAGFLLGLAKRHPIDGGLSVGMPPQLDPDIQFSVVGEKNPVSLGIHDPGTARDMAALQGPFEAIMVAVDERDESINHRGFSRMVFLVVFKKLQERFPVHRSGSMLNDNQITQRAFAEEMGGRIPG